jgi:uncharacterized protein (DUF58 family)
MIVPRTRLIFWVALLLPFAAAGPSIPEARLPSIAFLSCFALLVIVDAVLLVGHLRGIHVQLPEIVRMSKDRPGVIPLRIKNEKNRASSLRLGLPLPAEIGSAYDDFWVTLPDEAELSSVSWPCTPIKRGSYPVRRCYVGAPSPLGFWEIRASVPATGEIRVYPNLQKERKSLAAFFLKRGNFGVHAQRMIGKGRDFEKLREYIPGDSYDEIHWKATAKRGIPVTKIFQIERTQEIYVAIDTSRLSAKQDGPETALERFVSSALVLGIAAEQQGDLFGILSFSDKVDLFLRASSGKAHYNACRDALYTAQPKRVTPNFEELCAFIRMRLRRRSLLVILTDLNDPVLSENFIRNVDLIARQHLVMVNMIQPQGAVALFGKDRIGKGDELYQKLAGHILWHNLRELDKVLQRRGVKLTQVSQDRMSAQLVSQYLRIKQRQIL